MQRLDARLVRQRHRGRSNYDEFCLDFASGRPAPQAAGGGRRLHGAALAAVLAALMLTLLLEALDQTVVGTALPKINRHRLPRVQRDAGSDRSGDAIEVEDDQLRDRLRAVGVRDGRPARHPAGGGRRVHPALPGRVPGRGRFIEETIEQGTEHGYVSTLFGRRRQVPELRARRWELRKQGERFAVNMVIQGTAADIMKVAMVRCDQALARGWAESRLVLQIHDELLFEGPADEAERSSEIATAQMAGAFEMDPPLAVDAGIGPRLAGGEVRSGGGCWSPALASRGAARGGWRRSTAAPAKIFGGVVARRPRLGARATPSARPRGPHLPYGGGPVLHSNRTHLIFWQPAGSGLDFDPGYQSLIETFLADVAADSRTPTNVYGLSGQYADSPRPGRL